MGVKLYRLTDEDLVDYYELILLKSSGLALRSDQGAGVFVYAARSEANWASINGRDLVRTTIKAGVLADYAPPDFPLLPAERYVVEVYEKIPGAAKSIDDGPPVYTREFSWDGADLADPLAIDGLPPRVAMEMLVAFASGTAGVVNNLDGTQTITFNRPGGAARYRITFNPATGVRTAAEIL